MPSKLSEASQVQQLTCRFNHLIGLSLRDYTVVSSALLYFVLAILVYHSAKDVGNAFTFSKGWGVGLMQTIMQAVAQNLPNLYSVFKMEKHPSLGKLISDLIT